MTSYLADELIPSRFTRLDFPAGDNDEVPPHQKGKWMTSIFVAGQRLSESHKINSPHKTILSAEERRAFMPDNKENASIAKTRAQKIRTEILEKKLGLTLE